MKKFKAVIEIEIRGENSLGQAMSKVSDLLNDKYINKKVISINEVENGKSSKEKTNKENNKHKNYRRG